LRDLSLHVLDLMENAVRAGATVIAVGVALDRAADRLSVAVEDDGPGLPVAPEAALSPFYSTKQGKRTGLGLPLFQATAEQAAGALALDRSPLGGLVVTATMAWSHLDRLPLGDLAATLTSVAATNPDVDVRCRLAVDDEERTVSTAALARGLSERERLGLGPALELGRAVRRAMGELGLPEH